MAEVLHERFLLSKIENRLHNHPSFESCRELQKKLEALIVGGRVAARIDAHSGVLYARHSDTRTNTFQTALRAGESAEPSLELFFLLPFVRFGHQDRIVRHP